MKISKVISRPLNREDISNPYLGFSHDTLLKKAGVINLRDNIVIEKLTNGRIVAKPIDDKKRYR